MIYRIKDELFPDSNDKIRKLQEELEKNRRMQINLRNTKLNRIKKNSDLRKGLKANDIGSIKEILNKLFLKYQERITNRKIGTLSEFTNILLVGLSLYESLEKYSIKKEGVNNTETEIERFRNILEEYSRRMYDRERYTKYKTKFSSESEQENLNLELAEIENDIERLGEEINDFSRIILSETFKDYLEFKNFLVRNAEDEEEGETETRVRLLGTLAEISSLAKSVNEQQTNEYNEFWSSYNTKDRIEVYLSEIKELNLKNEYNEVNTIVENLENMFNEMDENTDLVYLLCHIMWANILVNNNLAKYPAISEDFEKKCKIKDKQGKDTEETTWNEIFSDIKAIRNVLLDYYDDLTYRNEIPVSKIVESSGIFAPSGKSSQKENERIKIIRESVDFYRHKDVLFYDLLSLNYNKEITKPKTTATGESVTVNVEKRPFRTYSDLKSKKGGIPLEKLSTERISFNERQEVTIRCSLDDFINIANALSALDILKREGGYRNLTGMLDSSSDFFINNKFRLKANYPNETDDFFRISDNVETIKTFYQNINLYEEILLNKLFEKFDDAGNKYIAQLLLMKRKVYETVLKKAVEEGQFLDAFSYLVNLIEKVKTLTDIFQEHEIQEFETSEKVILNLKNIAPDVLFKDKKEIESVEFLKEELYQLLEYEENEKIENREITFSLSDIPTEFPNDEKNITKDDVEEEREKDKETSIKEKDNFLKKMRVDYLNNTLDQVAIKEIPDEVD